MIRNEFYAFSLRARNPSAFVLNSEGSGKKHIRATYRNAPADIRNGIYRVMFFRY